jgi:hypothetical protein
MCLPLARSRVEYPWRSECQLRARWAARPDTSEHRRRLRTSWSSARRQLGTLVFRSRSALKTSQRFLATARFSVFPCIATKLALDPSLRHKFLGDHPPPLARVPSRLERFPGRFREGDRTPISDAKASGAQMILSGSKIRCGGARRTGGRTGEGKVSRQHLEIISDDSIELVIQPNLADFRFIRF